MGDDVKGVGEANQRQEIEPSDVLDTIFIAYAFHQRRVCIHLVTQLLNPGYKRGMGVQERFPALLIPCVKYGPIGQNESCTEQHAVTVGMCAAVHARCIVHHNASHHGRLLGGRVGGEGSSVGSKYLIHPLTDDARLQGDGLGILPNGIFFPVLARYDEHRVSNGLARQTGAGGTEGDRDTKSTCVTEQAGNFFFAGGANHHLRQFPVEARIRSPCQAAQIVCVDALLWNVLPDAFQIFLV